MSKHAKALKESDVKFIKKVTPNKSTESAQKGKSATDKSKKMGMGCIPVSGD